MAVRLQERVAVAAVLRHLQEIQEMVEGMWGRRVLRRRLRPQPTAYRK
jgi:hypothetical protein